MDTNNTMEYRIDLEKQNKSNDEVVELILDNCRASQISGLTEDFINLETLSLINVGLTTLKGFPKLPKLKKLELSDNRLTGGLNLLHGSPNLQHLNISGNRIKDFEALEPLKEFHDLVSLDLYNCEVTKAEGYRKKVFELLPNLKALDGFDPDENEVADSDEDDEDASDVDNHITREDNDSEEGGEAVDDDDDEDDGSDDGDEDLDGSYEESFDESEDGVAVEGRDGVAVGAQQEYGSDDDDDLDEDDEDEDDDDEDDDEIIGEDEKNSSSAIGSSEQHNQASNNSAGAHNDLDDEVHEIIDDDVQEIIDDDEDDLGDDDDDEDDDEDDLKLLQKETIIEDEDDADFEPGQEPDERDHEIDPEDDADEDVAGGDTSGQLFNSKLDTTETNEADAAEERAKRKLDETDTGSDEKRAKRKLEEEGEEADGGQTANPAQD